MKQIFLFGTIFAILCVALHILIDGTYSESAKNSAVVLVSTIVIWATNEVSKE